MKARTLAIGIALAIAAAGVALPALDMRAEAAQVADHLGVPGPIPFDGQSYRLVWSSKPSPTYAKHEYLPAGQSVDSYTRMLLVEKVTGGISVQKAVQTQVDMLNARKASDPLVNMDLIRNPRTGEILLDFVMSARDSKGATIVEWNGYRYAATTGGVLLFGVSRRAYGDAQAKTFLQGLKALRKAQIDALAKAAMPKVR